MPKPVTERPDNGLDGGSNPLPATDGWRDGVQAATAGQHDRDDMGELISANYREMYELGRDHELQFGRTCAEYRMPVDNPPGLAGEGFLYVIAFTTGTVKVGQTEDPRQRLNTHQAEAAVFGVGATAYWISQSHSNFKTNETLLIEQCRKVSGRSRREYYHEIGYERAVQFALALDYYSQITNGISVERDRR
jgi:predicted GIY-YIG superfamily endonuclease